MTSRLPSKGKSRRSSQRPNGNLVARDFGKPRKNPDLLLPEKFKRVLRYSTQVQLDPTTGVAIYQFRLNSLHDPDYTGTGHQPMGYDQLTALYQQWWVTSSRVTCHFNLLTDSASISSVGLNRCLVSMFATANDTTLPTTVDQMIENHNAPVKRLSGYQNRASISASYLHHDIFGVSQVQYLADDEFGGGVGSNPTRWIVLNIAATSSISGSDTTLGAVDVEVLIEFVAEFKAPIVLGTS